MPVLRPRPISIHYTSDLDDEAAQFELREDLSDNLDTLCIRDHGVIVPSYVKILCWHVSVGVCEDLGGKK